MLVELLRLEWTDARPQALHVPPHEIDQALPEPALAFRSRLRRGVAADDRLLEQEVEGEHRIDDLRERDAARAERERFPPRELLVADGEGDARHERRVAELVFDREELIERAVLRNAARSAHDAAAGEDGAR